MRRRQGAAMTAPRTAKPSMTRRRDGAMVESFVLAITKSRRAGDVASVVDDAQVRLGRRLGGGVQVAGARGDGQQLQMRLLRRLAVEKKVRIDRRRRCVRSGGVRIELD